jgi:hypothetical protein
VAFTYKQFIRIILKLDTVEQLKGWKPGWKAFDEVVEKIVSEYTMVSGADTSLDTSDDVLKHSKLFIRDTLTFWVFADAIRHEDVGTMWLIYTFWLFMFRGAGCHNYANEILEMVAQFEYEMGTSLRQVTERTWLVNRWGILGRAIPTDRYLEINNGFIKVCWMANFVRDADIPSRTYSLLWEAAHRYHTFRKRALALWNSSGSCLGTSQPILKSPMCPGGTRKSTSRLISGLW